MNLVPNPIFEDPVWYPYTTIPVEGPREKIARAKMQYVFTEDGHRVFDATSSWWCQIHGHSHPRLTKALQKQSEILDHVMMAPHRHEPAQALARELVKHMGAPFSKVFFSDNGSTAVEVGMKVLLQSWRMRGQNRSGFISLTNGYHGDTLGTVALSGTDAFHHYFRTSNARSVKVDAPYCYRCPMGKAYPSCNIACLGSLADALKKSASQIAGAVIEPLILGAGGMIAYPADYLNGFVKLCHEFDVPVIFDEVFTGFGRTGSLFAFEQITEKPDIVCLSKGLTSGMLPLGATVTTQNLFSEFVGGPDRTFFHGHTFSGNPLACAVALESLKIFDDEKVLDRNRFLTKVLADAGDRFRDLPIVGDVRSLGMVWAIEFVTDKGNKKFRKPANQLGWQICERLWKAGFWLRPLHQMLYLVPPYCSSVSDLEACLGELYEAVKQSPH